MIERRAHTLDTTWLILLAGLLLGAALRAQHLSTLSTIVFYDEAAYAVDAASLLDAPRLPAYFPANNGREGLWMAWLAPFIGVLGQQPFALRLAAFFIGVLTLAATYRAGAALLGRRSAAWAVLLLAGLYGHVHLSHMGFRALLYPLLGLLALAALLHAHRHLRGGWALGILLALLFYTYLGARPWLGLLLAVLASWALWDVRRRRVALQALLAAGIGCVPLLVALLGAGDARTGDVAIAGLGALLANLRAWFNAPFYAGDAWFMHNAPGRPLLDAAQALLIVPGLLALALFARGRAWALLCYALLAAALVPALLSIDQPHYLRAIGIFPLLALAGGAGARLLERLIPRGGALLALALLLAAGLHSAQDFAAFAPTFSAHLQQDDEALRGLHAANTQRIYVTPLWHEHPLLAYAGRSLPGARIAGFEPGYCLIYTSAADARYVIAAPNRGLQQRLLEQFAALTLLEEAGYRLFAAQPSAVLFEETDELRPSEQLAARLLFAPGEAAPGETVEFTLSLRALATLDATYNASLQLWRGDALLAQQDARLCEPYPTPAWLPDERIVQTIRLPLPGDLPPGEALLRLRFYDAANGQSLSTAEDEVIARLTLR